MSLPFLKQYCSIAQEIYFVKKKNDGSKGSYARDITSLMSQHTKEINK
jgi:hypothetical protein